MAFGFYVRWSRLSTHKHKTVFLFFDCRHSVQIQPNYHTTRLKFFIVIISTHTYTHKPDCQWNKCTVARTIHTNRQRERERKQYGHTANSRIYFGQRNKRDEMSVSMFIRLLVSVRLYCQMRSAQQPSNKHNNLSAIKFSVG